MKRFLPSLFILATGYQLLTAYVLADFDQSYQEFLYQYDKYRTSFVNFQTAKNRYLAYKTLVSQTEALSSTKVFLDERDQVIIAYLHMLLEKNPPEDLNLRLQEEIVFYSDHKDKLFSIGSLEEAVIVSGGVKDRYPRTEVLARQIVIKILLSKVQAFENNLEKLEAGFEEKITSLKLQDKDVTTLERWLVETEKKRLLAHKKLDEAQGMTNKLTPMSSKKTSDDFKKIHALIFEANQYLKEGVAFLEEIKEELKYGNY